MRLERALGWRWGGAGKGSGTGGGRRGRECGQGEARGDRVRGGGRGAREGGKREGVSSSMSLQWQKTITQTSTNTASLQESSQTFLPHIQLRRTYAWFHAAGSASLDAHGWAAFATVAAKLGEVEEAVEAYHECATEHRKMGNAEDAAWAFYQAASLMMGEPFLSHIEEAMSEPESSMYPVDPRLELLGSAMEMKTGPDMPELLLLSALVESSRGRYGEAVEHAKAATEMGCVQRSVADADSLQTIAIAAAAAAPSAAAVPLCPAYEERLELKQTPAARASYPLCNGGMETECRCAGLGRGNASCILAEAAAAVPAMGTGASGWECKAGQKPGQCCTKRSIHATTTNSSSRTSGGNSSTAERSSSSSTAGRSSSTANRSSSSSSSTASRSTGGSGDSGSSSACLAGRTGRVDVSSYFEGPYLVLKEVHEKMGNSAAAKEASDSYQLALKARGKFLMEPKMGLWHKHHKEVRLSIY